MPANKFIPIFNMGARLQKYKGQANAAMEKVLERGSLVLGDSNESFENSFADYLDVRNVIAVANGSDALQIAITSLGLPKGSKIGLTANCGGYAMLAILQNQHVPLFCDVDQISNHPSLDSIKLLIRSGANAIIVTHIFGLAIRQIAEIASICKDSGVFLIEDCSQSHGAVIDNKKTGSFGDISSFSFYPTKNLGALGDAGAIASNNEELAIRIRTLRTYGWAEKYKVILPGGRNSRMDEIQAEFLNLILPELDFENRIRRTTAGRYRDEITNRKLSLPQWEDLDFVGHLFVVKTRHRNELINHLDEQNVRHGVHYPVPDNAQIAWKGVFEQVEPLTNTQILANSVLSIPLHPYLEVDEISKVIETVNSF